MDKTLDQWLEDTKKDRESLLEFVRTPSPTDMNEMAIDIERSIREAEKAGELLCDAEYFLTQNTAQKLIECRMKWPDWTGPERSALVKDAVKDIQRLVSALEVICRTLNSRVRSQCNYRRSTGRII